jgi:hypothetical protein
MGNTNKGNEDNNEPQKKLIYVPPLLILLSPKQDIAGGGVSLQEADINGGPISAS